ACGQSAPAPTEAPAQPAAPTAAPAEPTKAPEPTEAPAMELEGDGARGGRLYDAWWKELGVDAPEGDQALWATQSDNKRSGKDTWRCKECHGWDYKGVDGAYGGGSHKTGFTGMWDAIGKGQEYVLGALKGETNPDHDFSSLLGEQDLVDLTVFLTVEAVDDDMFVGADKMAVGGDVALGEELFQECADCHGPGGLAINFHADDEPEYVPGIAQGNPWEFLNKMRYGQPGVEDMPYALDLGWTEDEQLSVLAFLQTLPETDPVAQGGRLYDKWWKALKIDAPEGDQPLWATQSTNERSGADTWRCKECHGWDYKGVDGAYGGGSHKTGFTGVWDAQSMSADELLGWLDGSANADHDFSAMGEEPMSWLVAFIQEGLLDKSFVNDDKSVSGDAGHGEALFGECAECHGDDGKLIMFGDESDPEYVGTIANDNPWEFTHKAWNGQPAEHMPSARNLGWTLQDLIDLVTYAQTLPTE
ncbi:MAG: hypothetical protein ACE5G8_08750, partial [Anaerolineae bacterium]